MTVKIRVKVEKLFGHTAGSDGGTVKIPHRLPMSDVLRMEPTLRTEALGMVPESYTGTPGYQYSVWLTATHILVKNEPGNSGNIAYKRENATNNRIEITVTIQTIEEESD